MDVFRVCMVCSLPVRRRRNTSRPWVAGTPAHPGLSKQSPRYRNAVIHVPDGGIERPTARHNPKLSTSLAKLVFAEPQIEKVKGPVLGKGLN